MGGYEGMMELMSLGYIRMDVNHRGYAGVDIATEPTHSQYRVLYDIAKIPGEFVLDLKRGNGVESYNPITFKDDNPHKVINTIKKFFGD